MWLITFEPLQQKKSYIPLLKVLMCGMNARGAQQHAGIFILWYTSLKMALLLHKSALVNFPMATTVINFHWPISVKALPKVAQSGFSLRSNKNFRDSFFNDTGAFKFILIRFDIFMIFYIIDISPTTCPPHHIKIVFEWTPTLILFEILGKIFFCK